MVANPYDQFVTETAAGSAPAANPYDQFTKGPVIADSTWQALDAGFQASATGLMLRGRAPSVQQNPNAPWYQRVVGDVAQMASDLPEMIAGAVGGAAAGSAAGPLGSAIGMGAGAFAVPMAMRGALMKAYSEPNGPKSWDEIWDIAKAGIVQGAKGALVGAVAGVTGGGADVAAEALGLRGVAAFVAKNAAQIGTITATSAALEGRLPTKQDFEDSAILGFGLGAAGEIVPRLMDIYAKTGITPNRVAADAQDDPQIAEQVKAGELPGAYKPLANDEAAKAAIPDPTGQYSLFDDLEDQHEPAPPQAPFGNLRQAQAFAEAPFASDISPPDLPALPTRINWNYLDNAEQVQLATNRLSDLYENEINKQRRGVVSWQQTAQEAQKALVDIIGENAIKADGTLPEGVKPGSASYAARLLAKRAIAVKVGTSLASEARAYKMAEEAGTLTDEQRAQFLGNVDRAAMIEAEFLGERAEHARALNILKSSDQLLGVKSRIQAAVDSYGGPDRAAAIARALAEADNPSAAIRAARLAANPSISDKAYALWKSALLSGPHTFQVKAIGDAVNVVSSTLERGMAATLGLLHGGDKVAPMEAIAYPMGMVRGSLDALKVAAAAWRNEEVGPFEYTPAFKGTTGQLVDLPSRVMKTETAFFRTINEQGELAAQAARQAAKEGYAPMTDAYNARIATIMAHPSDAIAAAMTRAGEDGTYTAELGRLGKLFQQFSRQPATAWIVPFTKVPANLVKWAIRRMPGVAFVLDDVRNDVAEGGAARDLALARQIMGVGVGWWFYHHFQAGNITGGFDFMTPDQRRAAIAAGKQPYSMKLGDTWYSYSRIDPVARIAGLAADLADMHNELKNPNDKAAVGVLMMAVFGHALISQTYLSGLNQAIRALSEPATAPHWFDNMIGSAVPAFLAQTAAATDPHKRQIDGMIDTLKSRLPGLRETLLPEINQLTGEPMTNNEGWSVINNSVESDDPVLQEAERLGISLAPAPKDVHVGRGTGKIGDVPIAPEQQNLFARSQGKLFYKLMTGILQNPDYQTFPDVARLRLFQRAMHLAREHAALTALPLEEREAAMQQIRAQLIEAYGERSIYRQQ